MTTTSQFQKKPDYYSTVDECRKASKSKIVTNPRYSEFQQTHFTAGDEDQFQEYRGISSNGDVCIPRISLDDNKFKDIELSDVLWPKYQNLNATCVNNTFQYMFQKLKKGIFVKIQDNKVKVFLPFSKKGFVNEWGDKIKIDPKFGDMHSFMTYINRMMGKKYKVSVNRFPDNWYANNCLVRSEFPINEGDTNNSEMSDMLNVLCVNRKIPDMEFFVNRRDFPVIKKNGTEPYDHMFGDNYPLVSHNYEQYSPILSMVTTDEYADVPIPTGDDWSRIGSYDGKFFDDCKLFPPVNFFNTEWKNKKPTAIFRGASTGCGVNIDTNVRLKLAYISATTPPDEQGPLLDAGISKWNVRPRKLNGEKYLQTIDVPDMNKKGIVLASFLTPLQQSGYKYIVHVDGHVSAFRLSLEMSMGCCILIANSKYRLWFRSMMKPMVDYVPVKADLSDLLDKIRWCRQNDKKCEVIAKNAMKFYVKYLQKDGMLDYLQKIIIDLKNQAGVYLYNTETPLQRQIKMESDLDLYYPTTEKKIVNIGKIPPRQGRSYGILKGMEWVINLVNKESKFTDVAKKGELVFLNKAKTVIVQKYTLAGFSFIIKATTDIMKQKENIHEAFIGTKVINEIVKYIPNFAYVFGKFDGLTDNIVIMEYIFGQTFDKWLQSNKFNMQDYIFILIQLAMALEVAQSVGGFVHYDLAPWNIMIQEIPNAISFDYMLDGTNVFRVTTKIIPVIIDYGKSHVIYKNNHHGYINMYKMSTIQDIISVLLSSLNIVTQFKLSKQDVSDVIKLANFLSGTGYKQKPFKLAGPNGVSDVQFFISRARKYAELISSNKHELEQKTPWDFVKYIMNNFTYKFTYEKIDFPVFRINRGNPRQVFEYVLSSTPKEKTNTFLDVFNRVIECEFPKPINMFFLYYATQSLEESVTSVYTLMITHEEKLDEVTSNLYKKAIKKIRNVYSEELKKDVNVKVEYELSKFGKLEVALYTEETFLIPDVILNLLYKYDKKDYKDLSDYKYIIEQVLLNQGMFKMSDEHREYYLENFASLLKVNSVNMKTDCANVHTLHHVARDIYSHDKEMLDKKLLKNKLKFKKYNCSAVEEQMATYNKIDEYFKGESSSEEEKSESSSEEEQEKLESSSEEE